jgi:hypothetical protein
MIMTEIENADPLRIPLEKAPAAGPALSQLASAVGFAINLQLSLNSNFLVPKSAFPGCGPAGSSAGELRDRRFRFWPCWPGAEPVIASIVLLLL